MPEPYSLENNLYHIEVDPDAGRIVRVRDKTGGYDLVAEERLAENFRILIPTLEVGCNYILGREQTLTSCEELPDMLKLTWQGPLRSDYGSFDIDVTLCIELVDDRVEFRCHVRNGSEHKIAEVWSPIIGGMAGLGEESIRQDTEAMVPYANTNWQHDIFRTFVPNAQELGVQNREACFTYPGTMSMPWINLYQPGLDRSLYFAALEENPRVKGIRFVLCPAAVSGRSGGNWPRPDECESPIGLSMNWTHFPYTPPGETFTSGTVVLQGLAGNWRKAALQYRQWFIEHFELVDPRRWIRSKTAALHTMFLHPEDNLHLTFKDIPEWAGRAKEYGIDTVCIWGWDVGGHDRGYPQYEPDPRVGTWDDLEAGVRACHEMGVRVYMFANCQPTDMSTDWYKDELHKYRIVDPYGSQYFVINYWGMGTLSARMQFFTARSFTEINPAHPQVREMLVRQMRKMAETGIDGIHIDKMFQTPMDFNPLLTWTTPDRAHHEGIVQYLDEMIAACREVNPDFCFSFEGTWDRLLSYSDANWWGPAETPLKVAFPQRMLTAGINLPFDFNVVNNACLAGDSLMVAPGNFTSGVEYGPSGRLLEYIREIIRIRTGIWDIISRGEIDDASEGIFKQPVGGPALRVKGSFGDSEDGRWRLFRDTTTGKRGAVLANFSNAPLEATDIAPANNLTGPCRVYQPFNPDVDANFPVSLQIPPEQAVFAVEKWTPIEARPIKKNR